MEFAVTPGGVLLPRFEPVNAKVIVATSPWMPTRVGLEEVWNDLERDVKKFWDKWLKLDSLKDRILMMSGSLANYSSKALQDSMLGKTAFTAATTLYQGLWAAALDDTFTGATASEAGYTSYARLALANNTTNFAAGTGTTTYVKTYPSDAAHSFPTSTGTGTNNTITYTGLLDGNAGSSADKGYLWCSVAPATINLGDTPQLAQNSISVTQD